MVHKELGEVCRMETEEMRSLLSQQVGVFETVEWKKLNQRNASAEQSIEVFADDAVQP